MTTLASTALTASKIALAVPGTPAIPVLHTTNYNLKKKDRRLKIQLSAHPSTLTRARLSMVANALTIESADCTYPFS